MAFSSSSVVGPAFVLLLSDLAVCLPLPTSGPDLAIVVNHPFKQTFSPGKPGAAYTARRGATRLILTDPTAISSGAISSKTRCTGSIVASMHCGSMPSEMLTLLSWYDQ